MDRFIDNKNKALNYSPKYLKSNMDRFIASVVDFTRASSFI